MASHAAIVVGSWVIASALIVASCREDGPPSEPATPAVFRSEVLAAPGIPEACRSKLEAVVASSQRVWDRLIDNQRTDADEVRHRDLVDATLVSYADAGCKLMPMTDLWNCIAFGRPKAGLTKQGNAWFHARCLAEAEAGY